MFPPHVNHQTSETFESRTSYKRGRERRRSQAIALAGIRRCRGAESRPLQLCCGLKVKHLFPLAWPGWAAVWWCSIGMAAKKKKKAERFRFSSKRRKPQAATRFLSFGDSGRFAPEVPVQSRHSRPAYVCIGLLYFHLVYGRGKIFVVFFAFHSFRWPLKIFD